MLTRLFWAGLALVAPLLAYFLIFAAVLDPVVPDAKMAGAIYGDSAALAQFQGEFPARVNLGLSTTILASVSAAGFIMAVALLWQRRGRGTALTVGAIAIACGLVSFFANDYNSAHISDPVAGMLPGLCTPTDPSCDATVGERIRLLTFNAMTEKTVTTPALKHGKNAAEWVTAVSALVGITASVALIILLGCVSVGLPGKALDPEELRHRWRIYRIVLGFAAVVFALSIIVVRGFYRWPLHTMSKEAALANTPLVDAAVQFWGVLFTLVLIFAALPGFLAIQADINRAAREGRETMKDRKGWKEAEGLNVVTRDALGGLLAVLTPVLTSPLLDALGGVFAALG